MRRLLDTLTALSLLLCEAVVALWVRSHRVNDPYLLWRPAQPANPTAASHFECRAVDGRLEAYEYFVPLPPPQRPGRPAPRLWDRFGRFLIGVSYIAATVFVALWVARSLGFLMTRNERCKWRTRRGLCPRCGYDLTGNVSGVCPECGQTK